MSENEEVKTGPEFKPAPEVKPVLEAQPEETLKVDPEEVIEKAVEEVINNKDKKRSIFITEEDRFDITVRYYYDENKRRIVEEVNDDFDPTNDAIESFTMTFKYPSQRDFALIKGTSEIETVNDIFNLEIVRIAVLFRKWDYGTDVSKLDDLAPSLSKAIAIQLRKIIQYDGIL